MVPAFNCEVPYIVGELGSLYWGGLQRPYLLFRNEIQEMFLGEHTREWDLIGVDLHSEGLQI